MSAESNFEFASEQDAIRALESEGKRLLRIARQVWRAYLTSYQPKSYVRTNNSDKAIKLGKVKKLDDDTLGIELTWQDDLTYHDSVVSSTGKPKGHSIMLISEGWKVKKGKHKDVYRFGYYEGFDYLAKVEQAFNSGKHAGISFEIQWAGQKFKKKTKQRNVLR
jgi:phosphoglucomutase